MRFLPWMRPRLSGLAYLETFTWQIVTPADRVTLPGRKGLGGLPHLSCKRDQAKMRDYMERRVTPPKRVTSPTWGPPPPCKQALSGEVLFTTLIRGHSPNILVSNIKANGVYVMKRKFVEAREVLINKNSPMTSTLIDIQPNNSRHILHVVFCTCL